MTQRAFRDDHLCSDSTAPTAIVFALFIAAAVLATVFCVAGRQSEFCLSQMRTAYHRERDEGHKLRGKVADLEAIVDAATTGRVESRAEVDRLQIVGVDLQYEKHALAVELSECCRALAESELGESVPILPIPDVLPPTPENLDLPVIEPIPEIVPLPKPGCNCGCGNPDCKCGCQKKTKHRHREGKSQ